MGPGGYIYPTLISETTAPALCATLRNAVERERGNAIAARNTSIHLLVWYLGARNPIEVKLASSTGLESFTATEQSIIIEARRILSSPSFARIRAAQAAGKGVILRINGRLIHQGSLGRGKTVKDETRRWVEAGIILAKEPKVVVLCPACQRAPLEVMDQALGDKKVERHMRCPLCGAYNSVLMEPT